MSKEKVRVLHVRWRGMFLISAAVKLDDAGVKAVERVAVVMERGGLSLTFL